MKKLHYLIVFLFIVACSPQDTSNIDAEKDTVSPEKSLVLTNEQIKLAGIETGMLKKQPISETIECTGTVEVPPKNIASVSPIIGGFIKQLNYYSGDKVEKGAVLASLDHPEFIQLQQQYLEAKSQAEYYQEEYKRQGELTVENAASIKKMQKAKADYLHYEASHKSLKSQLELLGVNISAIENGEFIKEFKLIAPISGTISQLSANKGKYVTPEKLVYEIIDDKTLNLHFNVFEKDISQIKFGQKIAFWSLNNPERQKSKVSRIGIKLNEENRTTMVHGIYYNKNSSLKAGMHIQASIFIHEKESYTLPTESVVEYEGDSYIFTKTENSFTLIKTDVGIQQNDVIEIIGLPDKLLNKEIVVKGTYYLLSKLEVEE